ncbi:MAG: hypothetical protein JXR40_07375 [Pontiellaceae bacterium]|nr:hypothetical protein [Pontiellaceae bacterium]
MELRLKLYYAKKVQIPGNLTCSACGAEQQHALFEGGVCRACWPGYDLTTDTPLCVALMREAALHLVNSGAIRKGELANAVGYTFAHFSTWLSGGSDSIYIAEAVGAYVQKLEVRHAG